MKRIMALLLTMALLLCCAAAGAETAPKEIQWTSKLTAHCATVEEGQALMRGRTLFHQQINEKSLAFFLQKKGGTVEEFIEDSAQQVLPFTPAEEKRVQDTMDWLQQLLEANGLKLPDPGTVQFVKTTYKGALDASGYTSEGNIFLSLEMYGEETPIDHFHMVVLHELSHSLSRLFPEYRQTLYGLIHFTVLDHDIDIPEEIASQIIANPDVEHHNSCAAFTINGEKKDCYMVFLTDSVFEKPGDSYLLGGYAALVPMGTTEIYRAKDVVDFWDVVGRNTTYILDPEEIMACNFSSALMWLEDKTRIYSGGDAYENPELLDGVIRYLTR